MRILKNNLYVQKKKKFFVKNKTFNQFLTQYSETVFSSLNNEKNSTPFINSVYNNTLIKRNKKTSKLFFLSFMYVALKKILVNIISFNKLIILLNTWFNDQIINTYTLIEKLKETNNNIMIFYINKKSIYINELKNKLKFNYMNQINFTFFKITTKLKIFLEKQVDIKYAKEKSINVLFQKLKTLLGNDLLIKNKNKFYLTEYLTLTKLIKKELIHILYNNSINKNEKIKDSNIINYLMEKDFNLPIKTIKAICNKLKNNTVNLKTIELLVQHKKNPFFFLELKKEEINTLNIKWMYLLTFLDQEKTNVLKKNIFTTLYQFIFNNKIQNEIKKYSIYNLKNTNILYYTFKFNWINTQLFNKNTISITNTFTKQKHSIFNTLLINYKWKLLFDEKKNEFITNSIPAFKQKKKKEYNLLFNRIIFTLNKKYGITYTTNLITDSFYYWTLDYNLDGFKMNNHLNYILEIQKIQYKRLLNRYMHNTAFKIKYEKMWNGILLKKLKTELNYIYNNNYYNIKNKKIIFNI